MGEDPVPGRLAALDQELAALDARLNRHARAIKCADVAVLIIALVSIVWFLAARPAVSYRDLALAWAVVALCVAGSLVQGRMLRSYRAEIRDLRARAGTSRGRGPGCQDLRFTAGHLCHAQTPA